MIDTKCSQCGKLLQVAENPKEMGDIFWYIQFSYQTFFFCSEEHKDEYAQ